MLLAFTYPVVVNAIVNHARILGMLKRITFAMALLGVTPASWAYEVVQAHVTVVEATQMPSQIFFIVDIGSASCPAGTWLRWINANVDNAKSVFALLIAAVNSGTRVQYYINNGDTNCQVQFIYALAS
jgi:hypothetical protein